MLTFILILILPTDIDGTPSSCRLKLGNLAQVRFHNCFERLKHLRVFLISRGLVFTQFFTVTLTTPTWAKRLVPILATTVNSIILQLRMLLFPSCYTFHKVFPIRPPVLTNYLSEVTALHLLESIYADSPPNLRLTTKIRRTFDTLF